MSDAKPGAGEGAAGRGLPVLCVDLDGTLIATDAMLECVVALAERRPGLLWRLPLWLAKGRPHLKAQLAEAASLDPAALPYRPSVLAYLREQAAAGRRLILTTAADTRIAHGVAHHLGLFDAVIATGNGQNLKGAGKVLAIREHLGPQTPFEYIGDADADVPLWEAAGSAIMVNPTARRRRRIEGKLGPARIFTDPGRGPGALLRALRPAQWAKNILLAVPMLVGHAITAPNALAVLLAVVCFSLAASAIYLVNDLLDLRSDRAHPTKRSRPIAAGLVPIGQAAALATALPAVALGLSLLTLPILFTLMLGMYIALTLSYSLYFKRVALLDVLFLAGLYTHRIVAGGAAVAITPSPWLLAFSMFVFLSLAFAKRYTELLVMQKLDRPAVAGRGYTAEDLGLIGVMGPVSGYMAVLVYSFYIDSDAVVKLYQSPSLLWLGCPVLLYWISRVWLLSGRGKMHDDPVVFALTDAPSYLAGLALALVVVAAKWL